MMRAMAKNCCFIQCMGVQPVEQPRARPASLQSACARIRIAAQSCAAILDMGADLRHIKRLGPQSVNTNSAPSYATRTTLRSCLPVGTRVLSPMLGVKSRFARAVRASPVGAPVPLCYERAMHSCARAALLAKRSIQNRAFVHVPSFGQEKVLSLVVHEVSRPCTRFCPSTSSKRTLVAKRVAAQRSWWRQPRPNPPVEGTAKRLRLLSAPHLER